MPNLPRFTVKLFPFFLALSYSASAESLQPHQHTRASLQLTQPLLVNLTTLRSQKLSTTLAGRLATVTRAARRLAARAGNHRHITHPPRL